MQRTVQSDISTTARDQVLATALRLFTERGYFNTSVHDVARESGVSIGSIYHHFRDKEGVAKALFDCLVARMETALDDVEARHADAHDRCRAVVTLLFQLTEDEPEVMAYMLRQQHREFLPGETVCSSKPFARMREMVRSGIKSGELRKMDPLVAAACLFGGPLRLISLRLDGILKGHLHNYLDEAWSAAWRSVAQAFDKPKSERKSVPRSKT